MYRQGDVCLVPTTECLRGLRRERGPGPIILARGEATGHAHVIASPRVRAVQGERGNRFIVVPQGGFADLQHEEHDAIRIPPGTYRIQIQREYTPGSVRRVSD